MGVDGDRRLEGLEQLVLNVVLHEVAPPLLIRHLVGHQVLQAIQVVLEQLQRQ